LKTVNKHGDCHHPSERKRSRFLVYEGGIIIPPKNLEKPLTMIKIIDEQLTMTKISMGINEQEGEKKEASEDVDEWELQNVTIAEFIVQQKGNYETSLLPSLLLNKKAQK
jgi:hypothetical protein